MEETTKRYRLWHLLTAFILGIVIVSGIFLAPSFLGKGFARIDLKVGCDMDICDLSAQIDELKEMFEAFTSSMSGFTSAFTTFTHQWTSFTGQWTSFTNTFIKLYEKMADEMDFDITDIVKEYAKNVKEFKFEKK